MDYREKGKRVTINRHVSSKYIKATIPYSKKSEKTIRLVKSDLGEIFNNNVLRTISNKEVVKNKEKRFMLIKPIFHIKNTFNNIERV